MQPVFTGQRAIAFLWKCTHAAGCPQLDYTPHEAGVIHVHAGDKVPILVYGVVPIDAAGNLRDPFAAAANPLRGPFAETPRTTAANTFLSDIRAILAQPMTPEERAVDTIQAAAVQASTDAELLDTVRAVLPPTTPDEDIQHVIDVISADQNGLGDRQSLRAKSSERSSQPARVVVRCP
jgi:hypothetical protein